MSDPVFVAVVGFLAAVGGGIFQAWAARNFEELKFGRQVRHESYAAYLKGVGQLSFAPTSEAKDIAHSVIAEARGRIALYGSPNVVNAMATAFRRGSDLHSEEAWPEHSAMFAAMRYDVEPKAKQADLRDLFELVYGSEPRKALK
jgi:hypothetical protein